MKMYRGRFLIVILMNGLCGVFASYGMDSGCDVGQEQCIAFLQDVQKHDGGLLLQMRVAAENFDSEQQTFVNLFDQAKKHSSLNGQGIAPLELAQVACKAIRWISNKWSKSELTVAMQKNCLPSLSTALEGMQIGDGESDSSDNAGMGLN